MTLKPEERLIFCDTETFGLDEQRDPLIEVGFKITNLNLDVVAEFSTLIWDGGVYDRRLQTLLMDADVGDKGSKIVAKMHARLMPLAIAGGLSLKRAEVDIINWLSHQDVLGDDPLVGSTISFDRRMLRAWMPKVEARFSYRSIDISSLKELCKRLNPVMYAGLEDDVTPQKLHRALPDLDDTIAELKWYRDNFLWVGLVDDDA